jgi:hypothetical protein
MWRVEHISPNRGGGALETCKVYKVYKCRIYTTIVVLLTKTPEPPEMRIQRLWPNNAWMRIWHNLHEAPVTDDIKMT